MLTIVLLPGMDGTGDLFAPFVEALGGEFNVQVVRYPTMGSLGYEELETIARSSLPSKGSFVVLGESFSGPIAVSIAASQPPGLVGLIMCSTFVRNPRPTFRALSSLVNLLPVTLMPITVLNYLLLGRYSTTTLRSALASAISQVSASALQARVKAVLSNDVSVKFKTLKIPVLYLLAKYDRVVPPNAVEHMVRTLPITQVVPVAAPHFLLQAAPGAAANFVGAFMRKVQASL